MSKSRILTIAAITLALSLTAAAQGRGHKDWGRQTQNGWRGNDRGRSRHVRDNDGDRDGRRDAWQARNRRENDGDRDDFFSGRGERGTPPGWSHGRKTGWGNCDMPPGQAKKYGCDNSTFGNYGRSGYYRGDRRRPYNGPVLGTPPINGNRNTTRRLPPPYNQYPPRTSSTAKKRLPPPYDQYKR